MQKSLLATVSTMALWVGFSQTVFAQQATPPQSAQTGTDATETIIVTGTRTSNTLAADSVSPVEVLPTDALQHTGVPTLEEVLNNVLPSFDEPTIYSSDMSGLIRPATLRGLQPDEMLVLIDGKRRHVSSIVDVAGDPGNGSEPVDLNMIPANLIDHIEVLQDGASAQYGSDAIAGVINIILKKSDSGGSAQIGGGAYYAGDGLNYNAAADTGMKLGSEGFLHISATGDWQQKTNRAALGTESNYFAGDPRNGIPIVESDGYGIPQNRIANLGFNGEAPLSDAASFYFFGTYGYNDTRIWAGYRPASNNSDIRAFYPTGFDPIEGVVGSDFALTGGVRGNDLAGFTWDLSETWGRSLEAPHVYNSDNPTLGLASPTNFYNGAWIAQEFTTNLDLTRSVNVGFLPNAVNVALGLEERIDNFQIKAGEPDSYINGGVPILDGPSAGLFLDLPGSQSFNGISPSLQSDNWRHSTAAYVDFETKLTEQWRLGLAGRFENFSDFGDAFTGKVSTRYDFNQAFAVRGAVNNGFRAPSLGELSYDSSTTNLAINPVTNANTQYNLVYLPVNSAAGKALGAQPLQPEKSINYSAGFVLRPATNFTLTLDGYDIEIKHRIVESGNIGLVSPGETAMYNGVTVQPNQINPAVGALLQSEGIQGIDAARYFFNGINTRTVGADLVANYKVDLGRNGVLNLALGGNINDNEVTHESPFASAVYYGTQVFPKASLEQLLLVNPKSKVNLTANYDIGRWSAMVRETRYGQAIAVSQVGNAVVYAPDAPRYLTDVELSYMITDHVRATAGAENLFNTYPSKNNPLNIPAPSFSGTLVYAGASPFGFSGGLYYTRLTYTW